jgi:hypothetical protein
VGSSEYVCKVVWARSGDYKVCAQEWCIGVGKGVVHRCGQGCSDRCVLEWSRA